MDNQLLGNVIPALMKEWSLPRSRLHHRAGARSVRDDPRRHGRRDARRSDRPAHGAARQRAGIRRADARDRAVDGVAMLGVLRFLAGLGLGGAMPNAAALASEYVPSKQRPFAVTLTIVCIPLGGTLAALLAGQVLPRYGWRALFVVGGVIPLLVAAALFKLLPESPQFLAMRRERWPELVALLRRFGHEVSVRGHVRRSRRRRVARCSRADRSALSSRRQLRRDTLGLCGGLLFLPARHLRRLQLDRRRC